MKRDFEDSEWFKEWLKLAKRDYHGKRNCEPFYYDVEPKPYPANQKLKIESKESK